MSLTEMLPEVQLLSRLDKIRLIQVLAHDLESNDGNPFEAGQSYEVWSPHDSFAAAEVLLQLLAEDKGEP